MASDIDFPAVEASWRFHPHQPMITYTASIVAPMADPDSYPASPSLDMMLSSVPTTMATSFFVTDTPTSTSADYDNPNSISQTDSPTAGAPGATMGDVGSTNSGMSAGLSSGAKIGIGISLAVVAVLSLIAIVMGILDCRRRAKQKKQSRENRENRENRTSDAGLSFWEAELKKIRTGEGLKAKGRDEEAGPADGQKEAEWLPAYVPRERTSVASLNLPIMPTAPRNYLDVDDKEKS